MTAKKYSLGFATPKREKANDDRRYLDLEGVEYWISNLPQGNAGQTARLLHADISQKNRIELDYEDRLDYLELIRDPLYHTTGIMEKYFVGVNFPLTTKQQKIASASRDFHYLMTLGYIIAAEELLEQSGKPVENDSLGLLIHRAITYLSRVLLISYQVYAPIANTVWGKLNRLYLFAEEHKIEQALISDNQHQYIRETTVAGEYARIVLLTLAEPYRLRNGEASNIYINLERWLELILPRFVNGDAKTDENFVINLQSDAPPCYGGLYPNCPSPDMYRAFDTQALVNEIDTELQRSELITSSTLISANLGDASLEHGLLRRLKQAWAAPPEANSASKRLNKKVELYIGISSIYQIAQKLSSARQHDNDAQLSLQRNFNLYFEHLTDYDAADIEVISVGTSTETRTPLKKDSDDTATDDEFVINHKEPETTVNTNSGNWILVSQSADEYYLKCDTGCVQQVQVGELIGLHRKHNQNERFCIAIISRIRTFGKKGITLDAKLLASSVIPIRLRMLADNPKEHHGQYALLLPKISKTDQRSSILAFSSPYRSGCSVSVTINQHEIPVRLTNTLGDSGLYSRFEFERLTDKGTNRPKSKTPKPPATDDDVWSSF